MNDDTARWQQLVEQWLDVKSARSRSPHTRRSYAAALSLWQSYLSACTPPLGLLEADAGHVRSWQSAMRTHGLADATINQRLSACSSFYAFAQGERRVVDGVESRIFVDRTGAPRENPFRANIQRGRSLTWESARHLSQAEVSLLLTHLARNADTPSGARAHALLLTYLYTGWRSAELLRMRWGDIRPSRSQPNAWVYAWRGKGDRRQDDVLPLPCYRAIVAYLQLDARLLPDPPVEPPPDEPVWLPVASPSMEGLHGEPQLAGHPISAATALRILRTALRDAGVRDPNRYRIHDLRHTHAHLLLESGATLPQVQQRLHHSSLATTGIYVRAVHRDDPVDDFSLALARLHANSAPA